MSGFIEALGKAFTEVTKEVSSFFKDSVRPKNGSMERPALNDSGRLSETKKFSDSERPSGRNGIERPRLKPKSDIKGVTHITCRNEHLAGKKHDVTGVPFEKKTVNVAGAKKEVVVPEFESRFDAKLPENKLKSSDAVQFKECNKQLKESVDNNSGLRSEFTKSQLEQIKNGDTPEGYTWHHDAEEGKMQLVDTETHQQTAHTGGRSIWGGGSQNR